MSGDASLSPVRPPVGPLVVSRETPPAAWRTLSLIVAASLLGFFGLAILFCWAGPGVEYAQFEPTRRSPGFVDGLILITLGLGLSALTRDGFRFSRALGIVVILLAGGQVLFAPAVDGSATMATLPGARAGSGVTPDATRWVVATLACLAGGFLVFARLGRDTVSGQAVTLLDAVVLGPALLGVCLLPGFGIRTPADAVPVLDLLGLVLFGLALFTQTSAGRVCPCSDGKLLPGFVLLLGLGLSMIIRIGLVQDRKDRINRIVQLELAQYTARIQDELTRYVRELARLSDGWARRNAEENEEKIGTHLGQQKACQNLARVDGDLRLVWIDKKNNAEKLPVRMLEDSFDPAIIEAVKKGNSFVSKPYSNPWEYSNNRIHKRYLFVYTPCHENHAEEGGLLSVLDASAFFGQTLTGLDEFGVEILDEQGFLVRRNDTRPGDREEWAQQLKIQPPDHKEFGASLILWPIREKLATQNMRFPEVALGLGILVTALLALATHLALKARSRSAESESALREREKAQIALSQSESKYRTLIENLGQGVFLQDRDHKYIAANAEFCRTLGWNEAQLQGMTESDLFDPLRARRHAADVQKVLDEGCRVESEQEGIEGEKRVTVRQTLTPVRDNAGKTVGVLGICWDVTEQRRLEAHVLQASKMDAIGQLAGGIAHDFNNLLTAILGNLQLISATLPPTSECREFADEATTATDRAASLTKRLLGFSRDHHQLNWVPVELPNVVGEVVQLLRRTIDPLVRIEFEKPADLPHVAGDPGQLHQVLMNLCINARDAIGDAGLIRIELERTIINEIPLSGSLNARCGDFVRLSVTDSGSGMTDEVRAKIFEPFFTTKEVGKGTGLGLAMVFAIMRQHDGWIECQSEPGEGTRFDLFLPCSEEGSRRETIRETPIPTDAGRATILVVDDEDIVRRLAAAVLRNKGYTVIEAVDGQQAVDIYARDRGRIDLVLLDLTMPVLSGHEAFRRMLMMNPAVKVIFTSGYSVSKLTDLEKENMFGFVNKPYLPKHLVALIADVLSGKDRNVELAPDTSGLSGSDHDMLMQIAGSSGLAELAASSRDY